MGSRNHYLVLGVAPTERTGGIRSAYRDLAKKYHPDRIGPGGAGAFREMTEAYDVLSSLDRRRAYDESLADERAGALATGPVEPLIPDVSLRNGPADLRPNRDAMLERFARNFTGMGVPKGEEIQALDIDLAITPEQAEHGARIAIGVPAFRPCRYCQGHGRTLLLQCASCLGQGVVETEKPVFVDIPPMCCCEATFVMGLSAVGVHNFYARVRVRIASSPSSP